MTRIDPTLGKVMKVGGKTLPYNADAVAYYKRAGINVTTGYGRKTPTGGYAQGPQRGWKGKTMTVHGKRLPYNKEAAEYYKKAGVSVKTDNRGGRVQVPWKGTITRPRKSEPRLPKYIPVAKAVSKRPNLRRRPRTMKVPTNPGRRHSGTQVVRKPFGGGGRGMDKARAPNKGINVYTTSSIGARPRNPPSRA